MSAARKRPKKTAGKRGAADAGQTVHPRAQRTPRAARPEQLQEQQQAARKELADGLLSELQEIGFSSDDERRAGEQSLHQRRLRRARRQVGEDKVDTLALVEEEGVLRWETGVEWGAGETGRRSRRSRRGGEATAPSGEVHASVKFERLQPSDVGKTLARYDARMSGSTADTPSLLRWNGAGQKLTPVALPSAKGRILLIVHGTFSSSEKLLTGFGSTKHGADFLGRAAQHYDQVLSFNHWTLAPSPVMNAFDLGQLFQRSTADVDIIAHSRGGLVTRWFCECFDRQPRTRRAVLVGSPLDGTSLAAPHCLRAGMDWLSNVFSTVHTLAGAASAAVPVLGVLGGLVHVLSSITGFVGKTPIVDAAVAMIPGLAAQSRTSDNQELGRLQAAASLPRPQYFVVRADFEPPAVGWKFWRVFKDVRQRAADLGADKVFPGPNDLVVDTDSMDVFGNLPALPQGNVKQFGAKAGVHHLNYFENAEVVERFGKWLQIP